MAILDYALNIMNMIKHAVILPEVYEANIAPANHPYLRGEFQSIAVDPTSYSTLTGRYYWDFATDPAKPVLGDRFGFRYSRIPNYDNRANYAGTNYGNQWIIEFQDAAGITVGGLRTAATAVSSRNPDSYGYTLVALGDTTAAQAIPGAQAFHYAWYGVADYVIECTVTATEITVSFFSATPANSLLGIPPTLIATVTAPNTVGAKGAVSRMRFTPPTNSATTYSRAGRDKSAYVATVFAVNEDLVNFFVSNTLVPTVTGGDLTTLPLLATESINLDATAPVWAAYFAANLDQRRTLKMSPVAGSPFPSTGVQILRTKFDVSYGLSMSAKAALPDTDLEFFTRYSAVNFSLGRFGKDGGTMSFELIGNPATGIPFDSFNEIQLGVVLREKV